MCAKFKEREFPIPPQRSHVETSSNVPMSKPVLQNMQVTLAIQNNQYYSASGENPLEIQA